MNDPNQDEPKGRGGVVDYFLPPKIKALLEHLTVDEATGLRTVTLPEVTITFKPPTE